MQFFTLALSFAGMLASSIAAPAPYSWNVSKWDFCRSEYDYTYSFSIEGERRFTRPRTPGFTAKCSGTASAGSQDCKILTHDGTYTPAVSADINIVTDSNNPNDNIPQLSVHLQWTNVQGVTHFWDGQYNATLNCGSYQGKKFTIFPVPSAIA